MIQLLYNEPMDFEFIGYQYRDPLNFEALLNSVCRCMDKIKKDRKDEF